MWGWTGGYEAVKFFIRPLHSESTRQVTWCFETGAMSIGLSQLMNPII